MTNFFTWLSRNWVNPIILLFLTSVVGKLVVDRFPALDLDGTSLWIPFVLAGGIILTGEIVYSKWLPSKLLRAMFYMFAVAIAGITLYNLVTTGRLASSNWPLILGITAFIAVNAYGGWKAYERGEGGVTAFIFKVTLSIILLYAVLSALAGSHAINARIKTWRQDIQEWVQPGASIDNTNHTEESDQNTSPPLIELPDVNVAVPQVSMPEALGGLSIVAVLLMAASVGGSLYLLRKYPGWYGKALAAVVLLIAFALGWFTPILEFLATVISDSEQVTTPGAVELESLLGPGWPWVVGALVTLLILLYFGYGWILGTVLVITFLYLLFTGTLDTYIENLDKRYDWGLTQTDPLPPALMPLEEQSRFYTPVEVRLPRCTGRHSDAKSLRRALGDSASIWLPAMLHYDIVIWSDGTGGWMKYSPAELYRNEGEVLNYVDLRLCNEDDARTVPLPKRRRT